MLDKVQCLVSGRASHMTIKSRPPHRRFCALSSKAVPALASKLLAHSPKKQDKYMPADTPQPHQHHITNTTSSSSMTCLTMCSPSWVPVRPSWQTKAVLHAQGSYTLSMMQPAFLANQKTRAHVALTRNDNQKTAVTTRLLCNMLDRGAIPCGWQGVPHYFQGPAPHKSFSTSSSKPVPVLASTASNASPPVGVI